MTALDDTHYVDNETVACDGGGGPLGHPRIWLNMEGRGEIDCPYCGRHFVLSEEGRKAAGSGH